MGCLCVKELFIEHTVINKNGFIMYKSSEINKYKILYKKRKYDVLHVKNITHNMVYVLECNNGENINICIKNNKYRSYGNDKYTLCVVFNKLDDKMDVKLNNIEYLNYTRVMEYVNNEYNHINTNSMLM